MATVVGDKSCTLCSLHKTAQSVCLMGQGPVPCRVMVIGEAPGRREDDINKPFSGDCGRELDNLFLRAGFPREQIYITNVVHCRPPDNRKPKAKEISVCKQWLSKEILEVEPKFVLILGATALKAFPFLEGKGKVTELRGRLIEENGRHFMITFHPGAILRDDSKRPMFESDVNKFLTVVKGGKVPNEKKLNLTIATLGNIQDLFREISQNQVISLDIETTGLSPFLGDEKVTMVGLGLKDRQWIVPLNHQRSCFRTETNQRVILKTLEQALMGKQVIAHNGKFDSLWLLVKYGVDIKINHDTMMQHSLIDENARHGLKNLAMVKYGAPDYDLTTKEKVGNCSIEDLAKYCAMDVYYTRRLHLDQLPVIKRDVALYKFYEKVVMPSVMAYRDIEFNGFYVDESQMNAAEKLLQEKVEEILLELKKFKDINWNSTQQLAQYLFDDLGVNPLEGRSTAESILLRLSKLSKFTKNPEKNIPALVLKYRESNGLLSKFISGWRPKIVNRTIHPSYKINGTVTGRPSCEEPNLQQTPRDSRIRSLIKAPPGWEHGEVDLSQAELRVAAMLSGDQTMKLSFQTGQDIHVQTAELVSGKSMSSIPSEEAKEWRKKAKAVNFGFVYGMGVNKFLSYARDKYGTEFTLQEGAQIRKAFFRKYNGLPPWYDRQRRICRINGCVRSLSGRIRHLPDIHSTDEFLVAQAERQAINSVVQGFVADIIIMAVIELSKSFSKEVFRITGTVHDSILFWVKPEWKEEILPQLKSIVEHPKLLDQLGINLTVPLEAEISLGPWGSGKKWRNENG